MLLDALTEVRSATYVVGAIAALKNIDPSLHRLCPALALMTLRLLPTKESARAQGDSLPFVSLLPMQQGEVKGAVANHLKQRLFPCKMNSENQIGRAILLSKPEECQHERRQQRPHNP
jgi:hypothetical protein